MRSDRTHSRSGILFPDATHASSGVVIFVRQGLSFSELSTSSLSLLDPYSDCVGVNITLNNSSSVSFLNVYAPPIRSSPTDGRTELLHPLTRSYFFILVLGRLFLLALPFLLGTCSRLRWSPPFPLYALALIPFTLAKVRLSPILTLSPLMIWYSGQTSLFLSFWQGRLRCSCQLLSLWH